MPRNNEQGYAVPPPKKLDWWDHTNSSDDQPVDFVGVLGVNARQIQLAGAILLRSANYFDQFAQFVDEAMVEQILDIAQKVLRMERLLFDNPTDAATATDGKLHIAITPDTTDPSIEHITTTHPPWITAADLPVDTDTDDDSAYLTRTPTSANPNTVTSSDAAPIDAHAEGAGITALYGETTGGGPVLFGFQDHVTPTTPAIQVQRLNPADIPMLDLIATTGLSQGGQVNGHGNIRALLYTALPTADSSYDGAIIRVADSGGGPDLFYMCSHSSALGWVWSVYQGPAGTPGTNGTNGNPAIERVSGGYVQWSNDGGTIYNNLYSLASVTGPQGPIPVFNTPAALDDAPLRVDLTGTGTSVDPVHLSFHIPRRDLGTITPPTGQTICDVSQAIASYALYSMWPTYIATANNNSGQNTGVIENLILQAVQALLPPLLDTFISDITGINTNTGTVTQVLSADIQLLIKQCLWCAMGGDGSGSSTYFDQTMLTDWAENVVTYVGPTNSLVAEYFADMLRSTDWTYLNVIGATAPTGSGNCTGYTCPPSLGPAGYLSIDFTNSNGGFVDQRNGGSDRARWVYGQGWINDFGQNICDPAKQIQGSCTVTRIRVHFTCSASVQYTYDTIGAGEGGSGVFNNAIGVHAIDSTHYYTDTNDAYPTLSISLTTTDWFELYYSCLSSATAATKITQLEVWYTGTQPL